MAFKALHIDEQVGIEASLDYLETILAHDSAGFAFLDANLRYVRVNAFLAEINGQAGISYAGRLAAEIISPQQWPGREALLRKALAGEETRDVRLAPILPAPGGERRHVLASYFPVYLSENIYGVAVVIRDVTAQVEAETQIHRQALAFENTSDALLITGLDGTILQVNEAFTILTGYTREEIVGRGADILHDPAKSAKLVDAIFIGLRTEGRWSGNVPIVHKDGTMRYSETTIAALLDEDGVLIGAINACRDVTGRIQAERTLRETQSRKDAILAAALDAVITIDQEERVLEWNPAAEAIFGYSREEALGGPLSNLIIPERLRGAHARGIAHYLKTGEGPALFQRIEVPALRRDGTEFPAELTALPINLEGRSLFTAFVRDITDRKQAAAALATAVTRQRMLLRDVLVSVTEGKLHLLESEVQLPPMRTPLGEMIALTPEQGLRELRTVALEAARSAGHVSERQYDLMTAASEAGMNAIVHAGGGSAQVSVGADGTVQVRVTDHGTGIALEDLPQATLARGFSTKSTLGHGLKMMLETADRLFLITGPAGTTVVLEQYVERPIPRWLIL